MMELIEEIESYKKTFPNEKISPSTILNTIKDHYLESERQNIEDAYNEGMFSEKTGRDLNASDYFTQTYEQKWKK